MGEEVAEVNVGVRVPVFPGGFIHIPPALRRRAGIKEYVQIIEAEHGLFVRPIEKREPLSWQQFFAQGLTMRRPAPLDLSEMRFDDLWL